MTGDRPWRHRVPYWVIFLAIVGSLYWASMAGPEGSFSGTKKLDDTKQAEAIVAQLNELVKFMAGLNTSLVAGALAVAINGRSWNARWGHFDAVSLMGVLCSCAAVYYGTYLVFAQTLEMMANGFIDPFQKRLEMALAIQFNGFMIGFILLGIVFCRVMEFRPNGPPP